MSKFLTLASVLFLLFMCSGYSQTPVSLIPNFPSKAPDYFCTWNVQGYTCSHWPKDGIRMAMNEKNMFGDSAYQNWVNFFPKIRKDLFFVMDDSWDIPQNENTKKSTSLGLVELNQERFPSYTGSPAERLKKLCAAVEAKGWKGLGGWICAQEAPVAGPVDPDSYWTERLKSANEAGFVYWKVDWGKECRNNDWRKQLTKLARIYAPNLWIEHAMNEEIISTSDAFRTYDVENVISQPVTIQRIVNLLKYKTIGDAKGIINCEDEPYIAVGLGCAIGVMRHPFVGNNPNNTTDFAFPPVGRDIKNRIDEVVRAVKWHRIAEPFGVGSAFSIDTIKLTDYWVLGERETWNRAHKTGDTLRESAPARVSRGLALPMVFTSSQKQPFVLSSLYPNGALAIVTIGRGISHEYITERIKIEQSIPSVDEPIGIFGDYESLTLVLPEKLKSSDYRIWGQDLAGDSQVEISNDIAIQDNKIFISGDLIRKVGLSAASKGDKSDPGLVVKFIHKGSFKKVR